MSKRTRIGRKIDSQRLAQLVSMPGIDPRVWVSLCVVEKVVVDKDHGVFADVHILSTTTLDDDGNPVAQLETVRVAPGYAGNGFGLFFPPLEGDEVVVAWPDGNPDHGGILINRLWSAADLPPQAAADNPGDALLTIQADANLRIVAQGSGNLVAKIKDGKVLLGDESGTKAVARKDDHADVGTLTFTFGPGGAAATLVVLYTDPDGTVTNLAAGSGPITLKAKINEGSQKVEAA